MTSGESPDDLTASRMCTWLADPEPDPDLLDGERGVQLLVEGISSRISPSSGYRYGSTVTTRSDAVDAAGQVERAAKSTDMTPLGPIDRGEHRGRTPGPPRPSRHRHGTWLRRTAFVCGVAEQESLRSLTGFSPQDDEPGFLTPLRTGRFPLRDRP